MCVLLCSSELIFAIWFSSEKSKRNSLEQSNQSHNICSQFVVCSFSVWAVPRKSKRKAKLQRNKKKYRQNDVNVFKWIILRSMKYELNWTKNHKKEKIFIYFYVHIYISSYTNKAPSTKYSRHWVFFSFVFFLYHACSSVCAVLQSVE